MRRHDQHAGATPAAQRGLRLRGLRRTPCGIAEERVEVRVVAGLARKRELGGLDASGKTTQIDIGAAEVTEADIGLSFYPGTQAREGGSTKMSTPDGTTYTVTLHSDDAPDKVAGFYRDKLKVQAEGKQFMETGGDGSHMLMLADDKTKQVMQVMVGKGEPKGSDIQIMANRPTAK